MKSVTLTAYPRTLAKRSGSRKLRASGRVPAVIYGRLNKSKSLEIQLKDIENLIHHSVSENLLVDLTVDDSAKSRHLALVQEVQHHPLSGQVLHVDLHEVAENENVTIMVPVESTGEAIGVKSGGGVLEHVLFKLKVRALPKDLPEAILVDVSALEIGQAIHIGDIAAPVGVEILGDKHISVLAVAAPVTEAQETADVAAAATASTEVEMIKEKKEDGDGAKAPAAGGKAAPAAGGDKAAEKKPAEKKK